MTEVTLTHNGSTLKVSGPTSVVEKSIKDFLTAVGAAPAHRKATSKPRREPVKEKAPRLTLPEREAWLANNLGRTLMRPGKRSRKRYTLVGWLTTHMDDRIGDFAYGLVSTPEGTHFLYPAHELMRKMAPTRHARLSKERTRQLASSKDAQDKVRGFLGRYGRSRIRGTV